MNPVCIGLGTNMGDREANLRTALERLQPIVNCGAVSDIFETEPVGSCGAGLVLEHGPAGHNQP